jgi:glycerophosphoryl diester phosphodiesterase
MTSEVPGLVAVSAHRGGGESAPAGTYGAYESAPATGAEYVEFDVRRTADGRLVSYHGARTRTGRRVGAVDYPALCDQAGHRVPLVTDIMRMLAGRVLGHLDLKETAGVPAIIRHALDLLGPSGFVVTTRALPVAAAIRREFPGVPVALTVGGDLAERVRLGRERMRAPGLSRLDWIAGCRADWAAVHHRAARGPVLEGCRQAGIRTMVWTVNRDRLLALWLARPGVDVVVTDRPAHAVRLRRRLAGTAGAPGDSGAVLAP